MCAQNNNNKNISSIKKLFGLKVTEIKLIFAFFSLFILIVSKDYYFTTTTKKKEF